jgi:hypothetical protein
LDGCQVCHGLAFAGSGDAVSCFSCHPTGPPFTSLPSSNRLNSHDGYGTSYS